MADALLAFGLLAQIMLGSTGSMATTGKLQAESSTAARVVPVTTALPGREEDGRVADIAFRLAVAGSKWCEVTEPTLGLVLQHLSQFEPGDRAGLVTGYALDRGPGVIVVVPAGPTAGIVEPGDVLLAIDGTALPPEVDLPARFDARIAHARADAIADPLAAKTAPFTITLLRRGVVSTVRVTPVSGCPSYVHLARSRQRNAYADGRHVFLTTGLVARMRDDDELAFVVAHEMAHNILRHATLMRSDSVKHGLGHTLGTSGRIVRQAERDADTLAGALMIDAGFDPVRGAAVLARLGNDLGLFAAHDSAGRRIAAMQALVAAQRMP
ncbi:M48 family metalloprotease [Sphingomonas albertensis]|uniref:M48 family metalloprotease n=1 Tax=Sphingomonas albertensis TaxID=2762591 RepID=A0ABR7ALF3_9SPHN|nr:M48 family metalloprotease [Sphingomonas albertensis]MBC3941296.1 M48 family metalloprotease [Sphingomonas albertensis]